jgi:DNA-binding transcriptional LysR family regulator
MTIQSGSPKETVSLSGLSIERLWTFCLVAETGSIAQAASGDATRQSQFSRQIKELEEAIGEKLFNREGKRLLLTESGRKLALATQGYFGAIQEIRNAAKSERGVIHLGGTESVIRWIVIPHLNAIMAGNPGFRFELHTMRTQEAVDRVKEGRLDLAIIRTDAVEAPLANEPIGFLDFSWIVPRSLLPGKSPAGIHLIKDLPMALLTGDGKLVTGIKAIAAKNEIKISIRLMADNFNLIIEAIQNGELATVLPSAAADTLPKERFAIVKPPGMENLRRKLSLTYNPRLVEIRTSIKRVADRIIRALRS